MCSVATKPLGKRSSRAFELQGFAQCGPRDAAQLGGFMVDRLEQQAPRDAVARREVQLPAGAPERCDAAQDLVVR